MKALETLLINFHENMNRESNPEKKIYVLAHTSNDIEDLMRINIEKDRESSINNPKIRHCIDALRNKPITLG